MSLINDALRRASQSDKERPRHAPTRMGMEPVAVHRGSQLSVVLIIVIVAALLLGSWFFWQWWMARNPKPIAAPRVVNTVVPAAPPVVQKTVPPAPVVAPKPEPVPVAAPVTVAPPLAVPPAQSAVAAPAPPPAAVDDSKTPWPADLKITAIFYSLKNPRAIINGNICGVGDDVQGIVVKKIEKNKVTFQWQGHEKQLMMDGQ